MDAETLQYAAGDAELLLFTVDDRSLLTEYVDDLFRIAVAASGSTGIMMSTLWNQSGIAKVGNNTTITYNQYCPYEAGT